MKMREHSTKIIYDVQSAFYDVTFARLVRKRIERAIEHIDIKPDDLVLDLGIGTGSATRATGREAMFTVLPPSSPPPPGAPRSTKFRPRTLAASYRTTSPRTSDPKCAFTLAAVTSRTIRS